MRSKHPIANAEPTAHVRVARRQFIQYLASSPLLASTASLASVSALLASFPDRVLAQSYDVLRAPTTPLVNGIIFRRW
jgi:hypothetical protein